ncbi:Aste57867_20687 [Aphanomyces stellatus]|uniref:Aste57867_20687 protein n=1 Tax=Aphanomyces stellatus TaxID=120398 RepID=A0A485LGT6_9STRA|nr:hypothetical protein As57867_020619 [Aphanomyces stellatus]VFT97367.1 Aste57867_20687 [Aphanomyces stellatus]
MTQGAQQAVTKDASAALELLFLATVGISFHGQTKVAPPSTPKKSKAVVADNLPIDYRECQRQLAAFDLRLAESSAETHDVTPASPSMPPVASTASLAPSDSKTSLGSSDSQSKLDKVRKTSATTTSSKASLPKSASDASVAASVASTKDSSAATPPPAAAADDDETDVGYLRCNLKDTYSDVDACSLDWCTELPEIILADATTFDRPVLYKQLHNLRLTKLAIAHIDAAFGSLCANLERIDVSDNALTRLEHLPPSVIEVDAYKNVLAAVHLPDVPQLVHLGLGLNCFIAVPTVSHPAALLSLDLSFNQLVDLNDTVAALGLFVNLRHLFLQANPLVLARGYRHAILSRHPNLYVLDDIAVTDKEKDVLLHHIVPEDGRGGADLSIYVDATGFRKSDATSYEATVDLFPGLFSHTLHEKPPDPTVKPDPTAAIHFEAMRVPLAVSLALRDSIKFNPIVVRIYEVTKQTAPPPPTDPSQAPPEPLSPLTEMRLTVNMEISGFLKPTSLEHHLGEASAPMSFRLTFM